VIKLVVVAQYIFSFFYSKYFPKYNKKAS